MHQTPLAQPFVGTCRTSPFLIHTFSVAWAGKDWLEVPPTIDEFVMVHLLTNFASQPFLSWPYVGPPQISWWGNDLGFPKPPCMCIIMYDETSLVTLPKVRALHCDVIFRSSYANAGVVRVRHFCLWTLDFKCHLRSCSSQTGGVLCSIPAVPQPFYPLYCCSTLAQHGTCMYHSGYGNKQPFKATALRQAPQHADIWPSCFGHWPSSVDLDTYLAISQWKWLAAPSPGLPSSCKHSTWRRHGDRSGVDGNSLPLAFCLMNSMPSFCGRRATRQTFLFPAKRRWWTWSSPHWCDKWSTSAVLSCQFDSFVRDHQPSDYVVRSPFWSPNLIFS